MDLGVRVMSKCPIAKQVSEEVLERAEVGFTKYGVNADRDDLSVDAWLQHLKEEVLDAAVYITKLQKELKKVTGNPTKPCPKCGLSCVLIPSQQLKKCTACGWEDAEWTKEDDEPDLYG
jgi:hypothetical protein